MRKSWFMRALALALMAQSPRRGGLCLLPSFTFAATAHAVCMAGLRPYFLDVDAETWALDSETARRAIHRLRAAGETVSAVVSVSPFGAPVDPAPWAALMTSERVAVALDAAAAFSSVTLGDVPAAISLHAVKLPGIGEGGFVLWRDADRVGAIRQLANFGFGPERSSAAIALNAKMSEYHAAVGHAVLDAWDQRASRYAHLARLYRTALSPLANVTLQPDWGASWCSSTLNVRTPGCAQALIERLDRDHAVDARQWWAHPCHTMPAWTAAPRAALPVTEALSEDVLALPFHDGVEPPQIARIVHALGNALDAVRTPPAATAIGRRA